MHTSLSLFFGALFPHALHPFAFPQDSTGEMLEGTAHVARGHRKTMTNSVPPFSRRPQAPNSPFFMQDRHENMRFAPRGRIDRRFSRDAHGHRACAASCHGRLGMRTPARRGAVSLCARARALLPFAESRSDRGAGKGEDAAYRGDKRCEEGGVSRLGKRLVRVACRCGRSALGCAGLLPDVP